MKTRKAKNTLQATSIRWTAAALPLTAVLLAAPLSGCRGERSDKPPRQLIPDMFDQPKWDPQEQTPFYADGRSARTPPAGTVAFAPMALDPASQGEAPWAAGYMLERARYLAEDDAVYRGVAPGPDGAEAYVAYAPVPVTRELLELGRAKFNIYCAACHGLEGDGKSQVGQRWNVPVANLTTGVYADRAQEKGTDGYLFHIAREGLWDVTTGANRMPGYKHAISEMETWGVVAYIRALQRARTGAVEDLSEAERARLRAEQGAPLPAPAPAGDQAGGA